MKRTSTQNKKNQLLILNRKGRILRISVETFKMNVEYFRELFSTIGKKLARKFIDFLPTLVQYMHSKYLIPISQAGFSKVKETIKGKFCTDFCSEKQ